jgi:biofilm protein TabA
VPPCLRGEFTRRPQFDFTIVVFTLPGVIYDLLTRLPTYRSISPTLARAIEYAISTDLSALPLGKFAIEGDRVFGIVMEYQTRTPAETKWETHRKYIDIQLMLAGEEKMAFCDIAGLSEIDPYDAEKDATFYHPPAESKSLSVAANQFTIFFPHDAHAPSQMIDSPGPVRKLVIKVAV